MKERTGAPKKKSRDPTAKKRRPRPRIEAMTNPGIDIPTAPAAMVNTVGDGCEPGGEDRPECGLVIALAHPLELLCQVIEIDDGVTHRLHEHRTQQITEKPTQYREDGGHQGVEKRPPGTAGAESDQE